jgi:hypothetical protein
VGSWRLQARSHYLRRKEREDTDASYLADWIPISFTPRAIARDWLRTHTVATGRLRQERREMSLVLGPAQSDVWEVGGGTRRTDIDGERVVADTMWLDGSALTAIRQVHVVERTPTDHFAYGRRTWRSAEWTAVSELRAVRFDGPDEFLLLPKLRLARRLGSWRLAAAGLAGAAASVQGAAARGRRCSRCAEGRGRDL